MPYRRSYRRPAKRTYRKRTYRKKTNYGSMAAQALSLATGLYGIINSELKHYDETNNVTPDNATGTITSLVRGMAQGTSNNTFSGNSVLLKQVGLRFSTNLHASATCTRMRILILRDTRPVTALPAITDILSAASIQAFMNIDDQINRFRVLMDKKVTIDTDDPEKQFAFFKRFKRMHIKFNDAQVPVQNDIILACISDEPTNTPTINTISRLRFYDN